MPLTALNVGGASADTGGVTAVDDRLIARWEASRRRQEEARRFLARQRFRDPQRDLHLVEAIVARIEEVERTLAARAPAAPSA